MKQFVKTLLFCCAVSLLPNVIKSQTNPNEDYYIGAVVEYPTEIDQTKTPRLNMLKNVENYEREIVYAKQQGADIIVFPEAGLTSVNLPNVPEDIVPYTTVIPDPNTKINACEMDKTRPDVQAWSTVLMRLSCAAKNNNIYVVVNLPERYKEKDESDDKYLLYNTNVVFDRNGTIIARYRKYNLFGEPGFNVTEKPELVTFTTDFGVTFGTVICFDILFAEPTLTLVREKKVTDIVYPTAWFSEAPFLTAIQTQAGWARANGVNLLASGYDDPQRFSGGSGIYTADCGRGVSFLPASKTTKTLIYKIPKIKSSDQKKTYQNCEEPIDVQPRIATRLATMKDNLSNYTMVPLSETVENKKVCHEDFCCSFTIKLNKKQNADYQYMLTVYDGPREMGVVPAHVQVCGLIACKDTTKESCGDIIDNTYNPQEFEEISISGSFDGDKKSHQFPSTLNYFLNPLPYKNYTYTTEPKNGKNFVQLKIDSRHAKLLTVGIYGKIDSGCSSLSSLTIALPLILLSVFLTRVMS